MAQKTNVFLASVVQLRLLVLYQAPRILEPLPLSDSPGYGQLLGNKGRSFFVHALPQQQFQLLVIKIRLRVVGLAILEGLEDPVSEY